MPAEMITPTTEAWMTAPLDEISRQFSSGLAAGLSAASAEQQAAAALTEFASQPAIWQQLPLLNTTPSHAWRAGQLIRFRGMVQDMHDPEFYLLAFGVRGAGSDTIRTGCGRYRDVIDCGPEETLDSAVQETGDRQTLRCVTIPRRTPWARQEDRAALPPPDGASGERESSAVKRGREEDEDCEMEAEEAVSTEDGEKKFRDNGVPTSATSGTPAANTANSSSPSAATAAAAETARDLPLPGSDSMVCLVKVYDDEHALVLNDMVEFVGLLTLDPTLAAAPEAEDAMEAAEAAAHHPPPSLAPRLHAVAWRRLEHSNPLLPDTLPTAAAAEEASATRRQLLTVLQTALLGDTLAAELLLCHLLSSVYVRHDVMALGKLALNVSNVPPAATAAGLPAKLYALLERLTEKALLVPMSIGHLNAATLVPSKDYKKNVLVTGTCSSAGTPTSCWTRRPSHKVGGSGCNAVRL